jgi:hypothetical protein
MLHTNKIPTTTILFDIGGGAYLPYRSASADSGYLR